MSFGITFAPLVPAYVLWAALAVAVVLAALLAFARSRGWLVRALALAMMVLALANPSFTREDREPLSSVVAVVVDKSPSQNFGDRTKQAEAARAQLAERLGPDELRAYMNAYLDHTERATRAALARIPDGVSENTDYMDDDGVTDNPIKIVCRIEKRGERISFDFTGTDPQNRGGMNCTIADVCSVAMFTARAALDEDIAARARALAAFDALIERHVAASPRIKRAASR